MVAQLIRAPIGVGKTETILRVLLETLAQPGFPRVWVILATKRQEDAFRQRLAQSKVAGRETFFNVEFFNFYGLYARLLDHVGESQRQIDMTARRVLLREILQGEHDNLAVFQPISHTPGLAQIVSAFIDELKQSRITPEMFRQSAQSPKDGDLAQIYARYQDQLIDHQLADQEGMGWLAVDALDPDEPYPTEQTPDLGLDLLLVDGFDQFTPVQADLLKHLSAQAKRTMITLTHVIGREQTVGRRFARAEALLRERIPLLQIVDLPASQHQGRHADLTFINQHLFQRDAGKVASAGGLALIEAPSPEAEVGAVLRQVKGLLLEGTPPDHILIALRDWERYRVHFSAYGRKLGLPLALHYGEPLPENPAVVALLNCVDLARRNFRRRDVVDVLRSAYIEWRDFDENQINAIEQASYDFKVVGGRGQWLDSLRFDHLPPHEDDDPDETRQIEAEKRALLDQARANLSALFDALTPLENATMREYVAWIESLIGEDAVQNPDTDDDLSDDAVTVPTPFMAIMPTIRDETTPQAVISRDLAALSALKGALRQMLTSHDLLRSLDGQLPALMMWEAFRQEFLRTVGATTVNPRPSRFGRVLVTAATDARGLPHPHVFVLGLSEGLFPARTPEDPLYLDSERRKFAFIDDKRGVIALETQAERNADDGLFYELVSIAQETLTLSRPTVEDGKPWLPSSLWRGVISLFSDADDLIRARRLLLGKPVPLTESATMDEAAIALATRADDLPAQPEALIADDAHLAEAVAYWSHIAAMSAIERARLSAPKGETPYQGFIQVENFRERVAEHLNQTLWSATKLNELGMCGFRFFARRMLSLEALEEPDTGMDTRQRGSLIHEILEKTYRTVQAEGFPIAAEHTDRALAILRDVAQDVFRIAPEVFAFRESSLWAQEQVTLLAQLEAFVRADFAATWDKKLNLDGAERYPYLMEEPFGYPRKDGTFGAAAIQLRDESGESVRIGGFIDRIDRVGDELLVFDYKTGSTEFKKEEISEGRNFQMLAYLLGAAQILQRQSKDGVPSGVKGGAFLHVMHRKASGAVQTAHDGDVISAGKAHIFNHVKQAKQGRFNVEPSKVDAGKCSRYCDYSKLCRFHGQWSASEDEE